MLQDSLITTVALLEGWNRSGGWASIVTQTDLRDHLDNRLPHGLSAITEIVLNPGSCRRSRERFGTMTGHDPTRSSPKTVWWPLYAARKGLEAPQWRIVAPSPAAPPTTAGPSLAPHSSARSRDRPNTIRWSSGERIWAIIEPDRCHGLARIATQTVSRLLPPGLGAITGIALDSGSCRSEARQGSG